MGRIQGLAWHLVLGTTSVVMAAPVLWALLASLKPPNQLYSANPIPFPASIANYRSALSDFPLARLLLNTSITALGVTALILLIAVLAGYAMVRFEIGSWLLVVVSIALVVPAQTLIIPHYLLAAELDWRNTYAGLIIPQLAGCSLAVLLIRQHMAALPRSLLDAATLDGARSAELLWYVVLPLLRPAIGTVAILMFISSWNEYLWPMLIAPSPEHTTIQMGLQLFMNQEGANHGPLIAAAILATAPALAVYAVASRRITDAFLQSGLR